MTQVGKVHYSGQVKIWFRTKLDTILLIKETTQFEAIHFLLYQYAFVHNDSRDEIHKKRYL